MQHLHALPNPASNVRLIPGAAVHGRGPLSLRKPEEICGWFDSSFDLSEGLEVSEQDSDMLYQLWQLSQR